MNNNLTGNSRILHCGTLIKCPIDRIPKPAVEKTQVGGWFRYKDCGGIHIKKSHVEK